MAATFRLNGHLKKKNTGLDKMAKKKSVAQKILNSRVTRKPKRDKSLLWLLCLFDQEKCNVKVIKAYRLKH